MSRTANSDYFPEVHQLIGTCVFAVRQELKCYHITYINVNWPKHVSKYEIYVLVLLYEHSMSLVQQHFQSSSIYQFELQNAYGLS